MTLHTHCAEWEENDRRKSRYWQQLPFAFCVRPDVAENHRLARREAGFVEMRVVSATPWSDSWNAMTKPSRRPARTSAKKTTPAKKTTARLDVPLRRAFERVVPVITVLADEIYRCTLANVVVYAKSIPVKTSCSRTKNSPQFLCVIFQ